MSYSSLPLDGPPQFVLLAMSMAFSVYIAQFLHRLHEQNRYQKMPPLQAALVLSISLTTLLFVRIGLAAFSLGAMGMDICIVVLLFLAHIALVYRSKDYFRELFSHRVATNKNL